MSRADEVIGRLQARIAELAREIDANCMREARELGILKRECDRLRNELAAMKAHPRMVVLPERANENEGNSYSVMQAMARNQALDEVARLNPCRAQAVPDEFKEIGVIDESDDGVFVDLHDDQSFKLGQKVYSGTEPATADARLVPVELLDRIAKRVMLRSQEDAHADACRELRALLAQSQGVKS